MPKKVGYGGTNAMRSTGSTTKGPSGTAAGKAAKGGSTKASERRTGGSTNSARQPKLGKQGS